MSAADVIRQLRIITSPEWKRHQHFPITVLAQITGLSRQTIYEVRRGKGVTERVVRVLEPVLADIIQGKIKVQQIPDRWTVIEPRKEERRFFAYPARSRS